MAGIFYCDTVKNRLKINFKLSFTEMNIMFIILIILQQDIITSMGTVDRPFPPPHFWNLNTRRCSSVGSMSALYTNSPNIEPRVRLSWILPLPLICQLLANIMGTRY